MRLDSFGNGFVQFRGEVEGAPEKVETTISGGVEVKTISAPQKGFPAHFHAEFPITTTHDVGGMEIQNHLTLRTVVLATSPSRSYREVEDEAARQLPSLLRALADVLDSDIERAAQAGADTQGRDE